MIKWLLKLIQPFLIWLGTKRLPFKFSEFKEEDLPELLTLIKPGDILLTTTWGEMSNLINWGTWKHAIMYIGSSRVIEAVGQGVIFNDLSKVTIGKLRVLVLTSKVHTDLQKQKAVKIMRNRVGRPYDYEFDPHNDSDYCSESVFLSYLEAAPEIKLKHEIIAGIQVVKPNHFKEDKDIWQIVYRK